MSAPSPLCPRKRTCVCPARHVRFVPNPDIGRLFDHLVGAGEQCRIPYSSQKVCLWPVDRCTYTAHEPSSFSNLQKRWSGEEAVERSTGGSTRHEPPTLLISAIKPGDDVIMPVILPRARANGALLGSKLRTGSAPNAAAANLQPASE